MKKVLLATFVLLICFALVSVAEFIGTGKSWEVTASTTPAILDLGDDWVFSFSVVNEGASKVYCCIGDTNALNTLEATTNGLVVFPGTNSYTFANYEPRKLKKISYVTRAGTSAITITGY